jgi:hypothetical protein
MPRQARLIMMERKESWEIPALISNSGKGGDMAGGPGGSRADHLRHSAETPGVGDHTGLGYDRGVAVGQGQLGVGPQQEDGIEVVVGVDEPVQKILARGF